MFAALTHPSSVVDTGCGVGGWVATWLDSGVDAIGVDGDYVPCTGDTAGSGTLFLHDRTIRRNTPRADESPDTATMDRSVGFQPGADGGHSLAQVVFGDDAAGEQ